MGVVTDVFGNDYLDAAVRFDHMAPSNPAPAFMDTDLERVEGDA